MAQSFLGMESKLKLDDYKPGKITIFGPKERIAWAASQKETIIDITESEDQSEISAEAQLPGYEMDAKEV